MTISQPLKQKGLEQGIQLGEERGIEKGRQKVSIAPSRQPDDCSIVF